MIEIKDESIRTKIHQTYRLLYLRDVVLARLLDDPTFSIVGGFVFFNQVDIINHIQSNDALLNQLFSPFRDATSPSLASRIAAGAANEPDPQQKKRDIVIFVHQLLNMAKGVQLPSRLALYRNLLDRGLLFVVEWAFRQEDAMLVHPAAEILTMAVELEPHAVRMHILREEDNKRRTMAVELIDLMQATTNMGLLSQLADTMRTLLETVNENEVSVFLTLASLPWSKGNGFSGTHTSATDVWATTRRPGDRALHRVLL